jgi:hypothetical protein
LAIHAKYKEVYEQLNTLHLIQTSNELGALPVFEGDSRITAMKVAVIDTEIGKDDLKDRMREEGPHFMRTLMDLPLPTMPSRMRVPVIETGTKEGAISDHRDELETFIFTKCSPVAGELVAFKDFYEAFIETLDKHEKNQWTKHVVKQKVALTYPVGAWSKNCVHIGNLVLGEPVPSDGSVFTLSGRKLIKETT